MDEMRDMDVSNQKNQAKTKGVTWNWHLFFFSWLYFGGDLGQWRHADNNYRQFGTADGKTRPQKTTKKKNRIYSKRFFYERQFVPLVCVHVPLYPIYRTCFKMFGRHV